MGTDGCFFPPHSLLVNEHVSPSTVRPVSLPVLRFSAFYDRRRFRHGIFLGFALPLRSSGFSHTKFRSINVYPCTGKIAHRSPYHVTTEIAVCDDLFGLAGESII